MSQLEKAKPNNKTIIKNLALNKIIATTQQIEFENEIQY